MKEIDIKSYNALEAQVVAYSKNENYKPNKKDEEKATLQLFTCAFILNDMQSMHDLIEKGAIAPEANLNNLFNGIYKLPERIQEINSINQSSDGKVTPVDVAVYLRQYNWIDLLEEKRLKEHQSFKNIEDAQNSSILFLPAISYALIYDRSDIIEKLVDLNDIEGISKLSKGLLFLIEKSSFKKKLYPQKVINHIVDGFLAKTYSSQLEKWLIEKGNIWFLIENNDKNNFLKIINQIIEKDTNLSILKKLAESFNKDLRLPNKIFKKATLDNWFKVYSWLNKKNNDLSNKWTEKFFNSISLSRFSEAQSILTELMKYKEVNEDLKISGEKNNLFVSLNLNKLKMFQEYQINWNKDELVKTIENYILNNFDVNFVVSDITKILQYTSDYNILYDNNKKLTFIDMLSEQCKTILKNNTRTKPLIENNEVKKNIVNSKNRKAKSIL